MSNRNRILIVRENINGKNCMKCRFYYNYSNYGTCSLLEYQHSNGDPICKSLILSETKLLSVLNNEIDTTYFQHDIKIYSKYKCSKSCKYFNIAYFSRNIKCMLFQTWLEKADNKKIICKRCQECIDAEKIFENV